MSRVIPEPRCSAGCRWEDHEADGRCGRDCLYCPSEPCRGHEARKVNRYQPQKTLT
jgi:hypothetical protein